MSCLRSRERLNIQVSASCFDFLGLTKGEEPGLQWGNLIHFLQRAKSAGRLQQTHRPLPSLKDLLKAAEKRVRGALWLVSLLSCAAGGLPVRLCDGHS